MDTHVHCSAALLHKSHLLLRRSAHVTGLKMAETELTVIMLKLIMSANVTMMTVRSLSLMILTE